MPSKETTIKSRRGDKVSHVHDNQDKYQVVDQGPCLELGVLSSAGAGEGERNALIGQMLNHLFGSRLQAENNRPIRMT
jgi:hypothetical protein